MPGHSLRAAEKPGTDVGQTPEWEAYKRIGTAALKGALIDPDSAKIEWPYVAVGGTLKALFGKRRSGFFTCGLVNARNRMGGYTGSTFFLIMIRNNQLVSLDIGQPDGMDTASISCPDYIKKGVFPLAAVTDKPTLGLTIKGVPEGAYVSNVISGSPAANAGLSPGMVIGSINNIQLKGLDEAAIIQIIGASQGTLSLSILGRTETLLLKP